MAEVKPPGAAAGARLLDAGDARPVHFMGIGGAGMSALAELFARRGVRVTGCDAAWDGSNDLARLGLQVTQGHDPAHLVNARAVVVTSAVARDHPELKRARELNLPVVRRAEALGEALEGGDVVAVAGTHGKTTTSVLTAEALSAAGLDPTAVVGARVGAWKANLRHGGSKLFVVEADEYDRSFLALWPRVAIVTNMEADHLDVYEDIDDIRRTFAEFVGRARVVVLCADDPGAASIPLPPTAEIVRYGLTAGDARLRATDITATPTGSRFTVVFDGATLGEVNLSLHGTHNVLNALAAIGTGLSLGAKLDAMLPGLAAAVGADRRFQWLGEAAGVTVVDDYAHHPTEIVATLQAARATFPGRRVVAAFQPHLFSRTRDFATAFGDSLCGADEIFLAEVYPSRESPIAGVSSDLIANAISGRGKKIAWRGGRDAMADALAAAVKKGDVVLTIGAGDVTKTGPELLARLGSRGASA